ncbi:endonuclease/exonuclease/phosphatase family protein [Phragmitibacter flavus]|uniref:endonuclease/exonuclease/phosphatase family protein n=1 Tax=Phragmitibacter flavus TaxID=2576071 RepID=UPI00197F0013|nr:endonuclease/exonuclease/phosphatase family protein [Phragmitibacter flavus]
MSKSWSTRVWVGLGEALLDESKRLLLLARIGRWLRYALRGLVGGYVLFLVGLWMGFRWLGEGNLTMAFLLYVPWLTWALPLVPLLALALLMDWKSLVFGGLAGAVVMSGLAGWSWHRVVEVGKDRGRSLTVFSFNRGQSQGASQRPFIAQVKPDILVFQEARGRASQFLQAEGYEAFKFGDSVGEYTLVSKFPVLSTSLVVHEGHAVAGRFVIDWDGREVAVYSVHLRTPRDALLAMRRGAFLWGVLGVPGTKGGEKRRAYEEFWDRQVESAEVVVKACREEKLPMVVAGDFNAPAPGYIHQLLTEEMIDTHEVAGWGGGYTFPGRTGNPLALRRPWLRIDKILCSEHWRPQWNMVEPEQPSQHRALAAQLTWVDEG